MRKTIEFTVTFLTAVIITTMIIVMTVQLFSCKKSSTQRTPEISKNDNLILADNYRGRKPKDTTVVPPVIPPSYGYKCIYLDFNGQQVTNQYWNSGVSFYCQPAAQTATEQASILAKVQLDYKQWTDIVADSLVITLDENVYTSANKFNRIRVIVTPTDAWWNTGGGYATGIAYNGSFKWGDGTPCFVFTNQLHDVAEYIQDICTHEVGHTLSLNHQYNADGSFYLYSFMGNPFVNAYPQWVTSNNIYSSQDDKLVLTESLK